MMKRKMNRENNVQATEDMTCNSKNSFHVNDFLPLSNANMDGRTAGDAAVESMVGTAVGSVAPTSPRKDSLQSSQT